MKDERGEQTLRKETRLTHKTNTFLTTKKNVCIRDRHSRDLFDNLFFILTELRLSSFSQVYFEQHWCRIQENQRAECCFLRIAPRKNLSFSLDIAEKGTTSKMRPLPRYVTSQVKTFVQCLSLVHSLPEKKQRESDWSRP